MVVRPFSNLTHRLLRIGLILKAIDGALELVGGVLFLLVRPGALSHIFTALTQHELAEDPTDFTATHLRALVEHLTRDVKLFAVAYLLVHGIVKIALALSVLRGRAWAYPWALMFFLVFLIYEVYRLSYTHSSVLAGFLCLDVAIVGLLWREHDWRFHAS